MGFETAMLREKSALLVIDLQIDFCPGGNLAVSGGDTIVPPVNRYVELFSRNRLPVFATRDWHPPETSHFAAYGGQWPIHCVQGSRGAEFHPGLRLPVDVIVVSKGFDPGRDDYSPIPVADAGGLTFGDRLKRAGVNHLYICGLATDYCVKWTALDALGAGFGVTILTDAVSGVDLEPGDARRALEEISRAGGDLADLSTLTPGKAPAS